MKKFAFLFVVAIFITISFFILFVFSNEKIYISDYIRKQNKKVYKGTQLRSFIFYKKFMIKYK